VTENWFIPWVANFGNMKQAARAAIFASYYDSPQKVVPVPLFWSYNYLLWFLLVQIAIAKAGDVDLAQKRIRKAREWLQDSHQLHTEENHWFLTNRSSRFIASRLSNPGTAQRAMLIFQIGRRLLTARRTHAFYEKLDLCQVSLRVQNLYCSIMIL